MGHLNKQIAAVTERIIKRSATLRSDYLRQLKKISIIALSVAS